MRIRDCIKLILQNKVCWLNLSFSQEGEDIILDNLIGKDTLFYVDIGALHPYRFSNTMRFYCRGCNGINVDATPGSMTKFNKWRKRDINIEAAITDNSGETLSYYMYKEGALNTFDKNRVDYLKTKGYESFDVREISTLSINDLLEKYLPEGQKIDFLDIDVEGFDEKLISSLDYSRFKPFYILTENFEIDSPSNNILKRNGYKMVSFTGRTAIYKNMTK